MSLRTDLRVPGRASRFGVAVAVAAAIAAFAPTLRLGFLADDYVLLERVASPGAATRPAGGGFLRPLTSASIALDHALHGTEPFGFHLTSVLLHALTAGLIVVLAGALVPRPRVGSDAAGVLRAAAAGLLFALWPCHGEAVAWVACRGDLLAAALGTAALALWLGSPPGHTVGRCVALTAFAAALLAKESVVALPLVVLAAEAARHAGTPIARLRNGILRTLPWLAILAAYIGLRVAVLGTVVGGYGAGLHLDPDLRHLAASLARFALRSILPWPVLGRAVAGGPLALAALGAVIVAVAAAGAIAVRRAGGLAPESRRRLFVIAAGYVAALLPVANLGVSTHTAENERMLYLPSVFVALGLVEVIGAVARRPVPLAATSLALALACLAAQPAVLAPWQAASRIAGGILAGLESAGQGAPIVVLGLPDSVQGASIFRHGLPEAMRLRTVDREVIAVAYVLLAGPSDAVRARPSGSIVELRGSSPRDRFYSAFRDPATGVVRRGAADMLPARGFLSQGARLEVELASFGPAEPLCFANPGLARCLPPLR